MQSQLETNLPSWRLTALLCLALVLSVGWVVYQATAGLQAWTFEDRRRLLLDTGTYSAPSVQLIDSSGRVVSPWAEAAAHPTVYLVDFIYTRCPTVCRTLGTEYQRMQQQLAANPDPAVRLLSVSVDLDNDRPHHLARYAASLHTEPDKWAMAVPISTEASEALLRGLGVVVIPDGDGGFVHNGSIHMVDEHGRLLGLFELDQWEDAMAVARRISAARRGQDS